MPPQSLRAIRRRIRSIENTQKLTKAMEMISVAKLRAIQTQIAHFNVYFEKMDHMMGQVLAATPDPCHPLLCDRKKKEKILLCLLTSDTGLCGNYNHVIMREAKQFIHEHTARHIQMVVVGKKGFMEFKKAGMEIVDAYISSNGRYSGGLADKIAQGLIAKFLAGDADEVYMAHTIFISGARRRAVVEKFLPMTLSAGKPDLYLAEPGMTEILDRLLPAYISTKMRHVLLNAFACEHSARSMAMGEATDNAKNLLEELILTRNKVRQANITREIIEVISSSEALKG